MKQKLIKSLMLIAVLLTSNAVSAHDIKIGGIYYNLDKTNNTAIVTYKGNYSAQYDSEYNGKVVIPSSITYNNTTYSVTSIENDAFYDCSGLTNVTIPNSVTSIGDRVFNGCTGLTSITIPEGVTSIGENAFNNTSLTSISVEKGNKFYDSRDNCNAIIETATNKLIRGCNTTIIPNTVTSIGEDAFSGCTGLTNVTIPNSVTNIGSSAFWGCSGLTSVAIPKSVTSIGEDAFSGCTGLTNVTIPNSVTCIGDQVFYRCTGLTNVTIPNSVTSIGEYAFCHCKSLINVIIGNSVTSIGNNAFYNCESLTNITIPESVTSIGKEAFTGSISGNYITRTVVCKAKTPPTIDTSVFLYNYVTLEVPFASILAYKTIEGWHKVKNYNGTITYKSKEKGGIYYMPTSENEVEVTNKDINCNSYIGNVVIPNTITVDNNKYNVTSIGNNAFNSCNALVNITVSSNVTSIGNYAFSNCVNLKEFICKSKTPPNLSSNSFNNCSMTTTKLYIPIGSKETYACANGWSVFEHIIEEGDNQSDIEDNENQNDNISKFEISDVNCTWGLSRKYVALSQSSLYTTAKSDDISLIYKRKIGDKNIYLSYKFSDEDKLCASTITFPENQETIQLTNKIFSQYDAEIYVSDEMEVKKMEQNIITYNKSNTLNNNFITIGFSYYEPIIERDDCVDLGLSVRWATMNLGSTKPSEVGDFYAWSETTTKTEYWRENYSYCNNNSNQYIFSYTNPTTNICGTQYDVVTKILGEGWRTPSLAEANELITQCTWEKETIDGLNVYRVTGPNGNSIIIPIIGWKKQNKDYSTTQLHLAIGESPTKDSEDFYVISLANNKGTISSEWKAWGYNIRPVYTK